MEIYDETDKRTGTVSIEIIIHRVNSIKGLKQIQEQFGTEIDIRALGSELILNHEPFSSGERIEDYLDAYKHGTLILNIKEAGIEDEVLRLVRQRRQIKSYFYWILNPHIFTEQLAKVNERSQFVSWKTSQLNSQKNI